MLDRKTEWIGWFVAFMIVSNHTTLLPFSWGIGYYVVMLLTLCYILSMRGLSYGFSILMLYAVCMLSITANDIPSFFHVWPRLGTFVLLTTVVSFALCCDGAVAIRVRLFASISKLLMLVTFLSFCLLLFGGGYDVRGAWFQGVTVHSMIMGPVATMSCLCCLYQLQYEQSRIWIKWAYYALILMGFICILQTGSRSALIGAMMSFLCFMYFLNKNEFYVLIKKYILIVLVLVVSAPVWWVYTDKVAEKNKGDVGLNTDSREVHWHQRIEEWKSSPIIGIGFGTVDASAKEGASFDDNTGGIETGNSWLCALSMTGILGFGCVLVIFWGAYRKLLWLLDYSRPIASYLMAIMVFFVFHMMAEGYIFAGGNFLNTQMWLVIGTIYGIAYIPEYADILEQKLQLH